MKPNNQENRKLTTVMVNTELFQEFRKESVLRKFTLQKLVEKSIFLYLTDLEFRESIHKLVISSEKGVGY